MLWLMPCAARRSDAKGKRVRPAKGTHREAASAQQHKASRAQAPDTPKHLGLKRATVNPIDQKHPKPSRVT